MTIRTALMAATALSAAAMLAAPALAKTDKQRIQELEQKVRQLEALITQGQAAPAGGTVQSLEQRVQDIEIQQGARLNALEQRTSDPQWIYDNGRPTLRSGDGRFEMSIRGRFHFDAGIYSQDPGVDVPLPVGLGGENVRDLGAGSFFRRSQFGVEGRVFRDFDYEFRYNFGGSETEDAGSINIMRIAYNQGPFRLNIGAIQPTFTLDDSISSNDITFLERAAVINTTIGEFGGSDSRKGIEATYLYTNPAGPGGEFMVNVAYTTSSIGARNAAADDRDHLLGRIAWRPFANDQWDVHVGVNAASILSMGGVDVTSPVPARRWPRGTCASATGRSCASPASAWSTPATFRPKAPSCGASRRACATSSSTSRANTTSGRSIATAPARAATRSRRIRRSRAGTSWRRGS